VVLFSRVRLADTPEAERLRRQLEELEARAAEGECLPEELEERRAEEVLQALIAALGDSEWWVRQAAYETLLALAPPQAGWNAG